GSSSTTVDINSDDTLVAAVNRDAHSVSIFNAATNTLVSKVTGFDDPRGLVFGPDKTTIYVSDVPGVTKITGADTGSPSKTTALQVCGEPNGIALSPTGARLFVACFDGFVGVVNTTGNMTLISSTDLRDASVGGGSTHLPTNAAAIGIAVTNSGDGVD